MSEISEQPDNEIQSLTSTKTTSRQNRIALLVGIVLVCVCVLAYPYARDGGPRVPIAFLIFTIPAIFAALMTAYLLFGQFLGTRLPSLAILGATYLYGGLINIPYLLLSPAVTIRFPLFGVGPNALGWLWAFLQIGYPPGIFLYVAIDRWYRSKQLSPLTARRFFGLLLIFTPLLVVLLCIIACNPFQVLPEIVVGNPNSSSYTPFVRLLIFSLNACMCIGALCLLRDGSVLHLWLRVSTLAALINVSFSLYSGGGRYSIGWYTSRASGLMAALLVLCALLYEVNKLYTRLAQQNEELAKQNRLQSDFLSVVGHEFRTALTGILGFSEMIRERDLNNLDVQTYAEDIHTDATRLTRLINDLLDLERMKSGRMELKSGCVEINALIWEVIRHTCPMSQIDRILIELDPDMPPMLGDRDKLTQVFTNLLSNALKYSNENDAILLTSKREGNMVHISVRDHGIGIPLEQLEIIFERYARVESTMTRYVGGTGLGLPIVRQIVTMHDGRVWAESTLGNGS